MARDNISFAPRTDGSVEVWLNGERLADENNWAGALLWSAPSHDKFWVFIPAAFKRDWLEELDVWRHTAGLCIHDDEVGSCFICCYGIPFDNRSRPLDDGLVHRLRTRLTPGQAVLFLGYPSARVTRTPDGVLFERSDYAL